MPSEELEALEGVRQAIERVVGWPLDKGETFAAFALMGLTSRLQPVQVNDTNAQKIVVGLAKKLGEDMALAMEKK
ncbi:MAG TPA: hypothetical protein VK571_06405 [Gemmatimonadaceae bacterium]|nr:hypothetical protein [Gemmatimonadaceae bacterium]